ncbi:hypothetical protein ACQ4WX_50330 [Streptomyces lasalocidi]
MNLTSADSGTNGHTVRWQAAPGQSPVISGGQQVTGWTLHDSTNNIYAASVPVGVDSRQLFVDGSLAPRAAMNIARSDVAFTSAGLTIQNSNLNWIANLPKQNRIELEAQNSFTDRFTPVKSISGTSITMQEPAWQNNGWGYDTMENPFAGGTLQLENSYAFLNTAGQWYLDPQAEPALLQGAVRLEPLRPRRRTAPDNLAPGHQRQLQHPRAKPRVPGHQLRGHHLAGPQQRHRLRRPTDRHVPQPDLLQRAFRLPDLVCHRLPGLRIHP